MNGSMDALIDIQAVAAEALAALDGGNQIAPFSVRLSAFGLEDAYRVTAAVRKMREARGELSVGRKIGFTNRTIWAEYNVYGPIWGYVYNRTVHNLAQIDGTFSLNGLAEPRIEPEIIFKLAFAPAPGMDKKALLASIDWVGHGFEIVQSIFPGWMFSAPRYGRRIRPAWCPANWASSFNRAEDWGRALSTFEIDLKRDGTVVDPRSRRERVGWTYIGIASSYRYARARSDQFSTRSRRDRHDGHVDACTSSISRRDMDDETLWCRA